MSDETKPDQLPVTEDETTDLLDAATDFLVDSAIPVPFWKNAAKALRQLSTAAIEWPAAYFEGKTAEKRAETKARIKIIEENTAQITGQIEVPAEYAQRAVKKYGEKILREQSNLDRICAIAVNLLKKEKSASPTEQSAEGGEERVINDDWLNGFEEEARQKSTEEMQLLFGRILAGEIRKPGAYSIKAVKILGQLDQNAAALFKNLCSICVVLENPVDGYVSDARVPSLGGSAANNALRKYGLGFFYLNILNEYGLIIPDYNSWYEYNVIPENETPPDSPRLWHQGRYWDLLIQSPLQFRVSGVELSRAGRELFHIVDQDPMPEYTEDLKKFFAQQNLQMVEFNIQNKT